MTVHCCCRCCVQVVKVVPKKLSTKEQEEKERAAQEELQRMDTDQRLQVSHAAKGLFRVQSGFCLRSRAVSRCTFLQAHRRMRMACGVCCSYCARQLLHALMRLLCGPVGLCGTLFGPCAESSWQSSWHLVRVRCCMCRT